MRRKQIKISRERAITLTMDTNGVTREMAEKYTDSELREVVKLLRLTPGF